jgi:hypothetical protein
MENSGELRIECGRARQGAERRSSAIAEGEGGERRKIKDTRHKKSNNRLMGYLSVSLITSLTILFTSPVKNIWLVSLFVLTFLKHYLFSKIYCRTCAVKP